MTDKYTRLVQAVRRHRRIPPGMEAAPTLTITYIGTGQRLEIADAESPMSKTMGYRWSRRRIAEVKMQDRRRETSAVGLADASLGQLAAGCRSGVTGAWEQLLDRYERLVFAVAFGEGLSADDAADVTQATFEALLKQLDRIRDDEMIVSWLTTVARRQAWRVRSDRIRHVPDDTAATAEDGKVDPISDHSDAMWIYHGLSQLDPRCRDLLTALYFDPRGPSYAEVATRLGKPVGSIGPTRARCLNRLRDILGEVDWQ